MKVLIEKNLYIEGDDRNIEVRKYKKDKKGNDTYESKGYFKSVEQAMSKVVDMKIAESQATTLKELKEDIQSIKKWLKEQLN